ncbi:MAG: imelysin family protein [Hyphomicrobiaceae bacterium]
MTANRTQALVAALAFVCAVCVAGIGSAAADDGRSCKADFPSLAKRTLEKHIRPAYAAAGETAKTLSTTLQKACAAHDADALQDVRAAFKAALLAWSRTEHLRFGPVVEDGRFERILYWPDRKGIGARQVRGIIARKDETATTVATLYRKSAAAQGFTALEVLLYGKSADRLFSNDAAGRFSCRYAAAISENLSAILEQVVAAWSPGGRFSALWLNPGDANPVYKAANGPVFDALKAYRVGIDNVREMKLLPSLGVKRKTPGGEPMPKTRPPFALSGLGLATMIANVEGGRDLYESSGLAAALAVKDPETARLIAGELNNAIRWMHDGGKLGGSPFEGEAARMVGLASAPLSSVVTLGAEALGEDCGMVVGFTEHDGD